MFPEVASANQIGAYPEASFSAPGAGHRYDGERLGVVGEIIPEAMSAYRMEFGGMLGELEDEPALYREKRR